jgi:hypothetical protein
MMTGKLRGVFIAHADFQGDTKTAVQNSADFAATITQALRTDFENEVREAQRDGRIDATQNAADLYADFEKKYKIKVVKVEF